mgnify:CR=1 FL=1
MMCADESAIEDASTWQRQVRGAWTVAKKNALLYYLKPPVLIFGVLFPVFFFLAFKMGRAVSGQAIVPGMVAMALWFTASAVGPLVTPWERRARTYERLLCSPVSLKAILAGDVVSGLVFGVCLSVVPILLGLALTDAAIQQAGWLMAGLSLGALSFATLGVLVASPPTNSPSHIMMLSNLVRLPLIFVSGVFVPIEQMPFWARCISPLSPLSYAGALIQRGFGQTGYYPPWLCVIMLLLFTCVMFWGASRFHARWRAKGL